MECSICVFLLLPLPPAILLSQTQVEAWPPTHGGLEGRAKIMASDPITSWQIDGETKETVSDFILVGSKITADGDCSHEI